MFKQIYILTITFILIGHFNTLIFAQELQAFLKLRADGVVVDALDRNDPDLIFWHDDVISSGIKV